MAGTCDGIITIEAPSAECTGIYGDVNGDGIVNGVDAQFIAQYVAGTRTLDACQLKKADVNGDGIVDAVDAQYIANFTVGNTPYGKTGQPYP